MQPVIVNRFPSLFCHLYWHEVSLGETCPPSVLFHLLWPLRFLQPWSIPVSLFRGCNNSWTSNEPYSSAARSTVSHTIHATWYTQNTGSRYRRPNACTCFSRACRVSLSFVSTISLSAVMLTLSRSASSSSSILPSLLFIWRWRQVRPQPQLILSHLHTKTCIGAASGRKWDSPEGRDEGCYETRIKKTIYVITLTWIQQVFSL